MDATSTPWTPTPASPVISENFIGIKHPRKWVPSDWRGAHPFPLAPPEVYFSVLDALEDTPEVTDVQILVRLGDRFEDLPDYDDLALLIAKTRLDLSTMWHKPYHDKTPEEREALVKSRTNWLRCRMTAGFERAGEIGIPPTRHLIYQMRKLFGSASDHALMHEIREELLAGAESPAVESPAVERQLFSKAVSEGLCFYKTLHHSTLAKLSLWVHNNENRKTAPSDCLKRYFAQAPGGQIQFCVLMRMTVPGISNGTIHRCYESLTGMGLGSHVLQVMDTELEARGILPRVLEQEPEEPEATPEEREPEHVCEHDDPANDCPNCGTPPETKSEPQFMRLHPDDRAALVAELRDAFRAEALSTLSDLAEGQRKILVETERARQQAAETIQVATQHFVPIMNNLDKVVGGLERISSAMVAIQRQTAGHPTVALDTNSVALIRGLENRVVDSVTQALPALVDTAWNESDRHNDILAIPREIEELINATVMPQFVAMRDATSASAPTPAGVSVDTLRSLVESGRGFELKVKPHKGG